MKKIKPRKGRHDYDKKYDILYFRVKGPAYEHSIEIENFVLDFDPKNRFIGIQIFQASEFLETTKDALDKIQKWQFSIEVIDKKVIINLLVKVKENNKIVEKHPTIQHLIKENITSSAVSCSS
jgi:uncharacterized protein YuzE